MLSIARSSRHLFSHHISPTTTLLYRIKPAYLLLKNNHQRRTLQIRNQQYSSSNPTEPLSVSITPDATTRLLQISRKENNPSLALRVLVSSGGCHGFQYSMSLEDLSKPGMLDEAEDSIFEEGENMDSGGDEEREYKARVVLDLASLELLNKSKIDYTNELIGSQFKVVDNPAAKSACGCGTSFDIVV